MASEARRAAAAEGAEELSPLDSGLRKSGPNGSEVKFDHFRTSSQNLTVVSCFSDTLFLSSSWIERVIKNVALHSFWLSQVQSVQLSD